jgi:hypothetical protein
MKLQTILALFPALTYGCGVLLASQSSYPQGPVLILLSFLGSIQRSLEELYSTLPNQRKIRVLFTRTLSTTSLSSFLLCDWVPSFQTGAITVYLARQTHPKQHIGPHSSAPPSTTFTKPTVKTRRIGATMHGVLSESSSALPVMEAQM